jgi:hypothetical protein
MNDTPVVLITDAQQYVGPALMPRTSRGGARIINCGASALNIVHCPARVFTDREGEPCQLSALSP